MLLLCSLYYMKDFYNITRKIANTAGSKTVPVKNNDGVLITNIEDQLNRWKEHFTKVLN